MPATTTLVCCFWTCILRISHALNGFLELVFRFYLASLYAHFWRWFFTTFKCCKGVTLWYYSKYECFFFVFAVSKGTYLISNHSACRFSDYILKIVSRLVIARSIVYYYCGGDRARRRRDAYWSSLWLQRLCVCHSSTSLRSNTLWLRTIALRCCNRESAVIVCAIIVI